ncbi:MAG: Polypeptide-transport-associated domain protein FtsQ-type [Clostridia bacterium 41_269]|nr:MAG: Polypeptide-transport-associated domain protein FtsQ-type [Clostridia bacterium 41_269]
MKKVFLFLLLVLALYFIFHSEIFNIDTLTVKGNKLLSREKVIKLSGVKKGTNIFKVNVREIEEKIEDHPVVKNASVKRIFPDTLAVEVQEHKPSAVIAVEGGFVLLDAEGYCIERVEKVSYMSLPIITGVEVEEKVSPGDKISNKKLDLALKVLSSSNPNDLSFAAEIDVNNPVCINLYTRSGIKIILGEAEKIGEKIETAKKVLSQLDRQIDYIDLRYPKSPVVKYFN